MSWADVKEFIDHFRTDQVMQQLKTMEAGDLKSNPWFLGLFVTSILLAYFLGKRAIAGFIVGIGGFILVLSWAISRGTGTEGISGGGLYVVIGGGAVAVGLFIYLLFIKSD